VRQRTQKINKITIIGGELRSRVIRFPDADGLRPTPSRVRETLFNWLGQTLHGRACLDLFSGSGALGFEAASRGAEHVVMIERDQIVFRALQDNLHNLKCTNVFLQCQDGLKFAQHDTQKYDVIFVDPPFQSNYLSKLMESLSQRLNENGVIYVECGTAMSPSPFWQVIKSGKAGQVHYQLLKMPKD